MLIRKARYNNIVYIQVLKEGNLLECTDKKILENVVRLRYPNKYISMFIFDRCNNARVISI